MESKIQKLRIKNEIKFWYTKKQNLNKGFYALHLQNANKWGNLWDIINQNIPKKIEQKMGKNIEP
jgi:hypothetical protein